MIYLDADIIVNLDIAELWRQDLKTFPLAAVPELSATHGQMITDKFLLKTERVKAEDYFCSGVMMFNLDRLNEKFFYYGVQFLTNNPACESPDQDILNAFFSDNYLRLEQRFDSFVNTETELPAQKIYHYAGNSFGFNLLNPYDKLWLENFARTPWFDFDSLQRLAEEIHNVEDELLLQTQWMIHISNTKRRVFFADADNLTAIANLLGARDDDGFIESRRISDELLPVTFDDLVAQMTAERGRTIFFIFDLNYIYINLKLRKCGFSEYEDFVDGLSLLTRKQSGQTRPGRNFIKAL